MTSGAIAWWVEANRAAVCAPILIMDTPPLFSVLASLCQTMEMLV